MCGRGTLVKREGGKYEGDFVSGVKEGEGVETWGNELGIKYDCPMVKIYIPPFYNLYHTHPFMLL